MPTTCTQDGDRSWTCAAVYHWTKNADLAHAASWLIGKPLSIAWLLVIGLVARWLLHKVIDRLVARARDGVLPAKLARGPFAEPGGDTTTHRRVQRALDDGQPAQEASCPASSS